MQTSTVLIASDRLLAVWSTVAPTRDVLTVREDDVGAALEIIRRHRPGTVVMEEAFAFSAHAASLVARLQTDREFKSTEVRVLMPESVATLRSTKSGESQPHAISLATLTRPLAQRATRVRPGRPVDILVNGKPASLLNLSQSGTQVRSLVVLRPKERVRISLPLQRSEPVKAEGIVVWSAFEPASPPTYRVGIKLVTSLHFTAEELLSRILPA